MLCTFKISSNEHVPRKAEFLVLSMTTSSSLGASSFRMRLSNPVVISPTIRVFLCDRADFYRNDLLNTLACPDE